MDSLIKMDKSGRVAYLTLNRPEKKNALNDALVNQLTASFSELESDAGVKVIILRAEGDVFSAGADLDYLQKLQNNTFNENLADSEKLKDLLLKIYTNKKPVIAQVEGHAIAGGCGLASVCDFCFAVPEAKFGYTEVRIGFIPAIVSVFLSRRIRGGDMRELLLTGKLIDARRALEIGLINALFEKVEIKERVFQFATALCEEVSAQSMAATKELLSRIHSMELHDALNLAAETNAHMRASDDCKKGIAAFLNREKPQW
jgi:methylglutaconyl-CoA hydratase